MRALIIAALLIACGKVAEAQVPDAPRTPEPQSQLDQGPPAQGRQALIVPAGTRIQLKLVNPIQTRHARRGDAVRATTAFPVTVGTAMAIPAETFVEGEIEKVRKRGYPALQVRFTRLVFNNGYALLLDGATPQAKANAPAATPPPASAPAPGVQTALGTGMTNQPVPQPPSLPRVGPNPAVFIGIGLGITAATLVTGVLWAHHRGQDITLEAGSSLEMVLERPLSLNADSVAAALATR